MPTSLLCPESPKLVKIPFFICFYPFLIILLAHGLSRLNASLKWIVIILISLIFIGNILSYINFIKFGRGHYLQALNYMYDHSRSLPIAVAGDQDFQVATLLNFYTIFKPEAKIDYITHPQTKGHSPEWYIVQSPKQNPDLNRYIVVAGNTYQLEKVYRYCGDFSGVSWLIYHRLGTI